MPCLLSGGQLAVHLAVPAQPAHGRARDAAVDEEAGGRGVHVVELAVDGGEVAVEERAPGRGSVEREGPGVGSQASVRASLQSTLLSNLIQAGGLTH